MLSRGFSCPVFSVPMLDTELGEVAKKKRFRSCKFHIIDNCTDDLTSHIDSSVEECFEQVPRLRRVFLF